MTKTEIKEAKAIKEAKELRTTLIELERIGALDSDGHALVGELTRWLIHIQP